MLKLRSIFNIESVKKCLNIRRLSGHIRNTPNRKSVNNKKKQPILQISYHSYKEYQKDKEYQTDTNIKISNISQNNSENVITNKYNSILQDKDIFSFKYNIICELGKSKNSFVYKIKDSDGNIHVMKELDIKYKNSALRECYIQKKITGSEYFPEYEFCIDDVDKIRIISKYVEYTDMFEWAIKKIKNKSFNEATIKDLFCKMLKCVKELHSLGFVHLDLKLENFIISKDGEMNIKLIDFEMAHEMTDRQKKIIKTIGTRGYLSLEGYLGYYCNKTDIWALGTCLWILLTGDMPFLQNDFSRKDFQYVQDLSTISDKFKFPTSRHLKIAKNENINSDAVDLIASMMAIYPNDRIDIIDIEKHKWLK